MLYWLFLEPSKGYSCDLFAEASDGDLIKYIDDSKVGRFLKISELFYKKLFTKKDSSNRM